MWDRRVVRGNTYAQHTLPAAAQPDPIEIQRQQEQRRRMLARKRAKDQLRPRSPDPVEGKLLKPTKLMMLTPLIGYVSDIIFIHESMVNC